jgi:hypothetical protein
MPTEAELRAAIEELANEARPPADPAATPLRSSSQRASRLVPALAVVVVLAVAGLIVLLSHRSGRNDGAATATQSLASSTPSIPPPDCGPAISAEVCARVLSYAREQANRSVSRPAPDPDGWPGAVTLVSVLEHAGTETQPNVGPACDSGQLVTVDVIGTFDRVAVAPPPLASGQPAHDYTVDDIVINADAQSGRACLLSVRSREGGPAQAPDGATIVYRAR